MKTFEECQRIAGGERMALMISTALQMLPEVLWLRESNSSRSWEEAPWRQAPTHLLESASTEENYICKRFFYLAWKSLYDEMELFLLSSAVVGHSPFPHIRKATMTKSLRIWNWQFFPLQDLLKKILLNLVKMATTCIQWSSASPLTCSCRHCNL